MDKYRKVKQLKENNNNVYLAETMGTGRLVVIKELQTHPSVANEIRLLSSLQHPNVVRLLDWFFVSGERVAFVMEYCEMGDLPLLAPSLAPLIPEITVQLLLALKYLHGNGVLHRDLKLENVFAAGWQNGILRVKVGDFGVAKQFTNGQTETMLGTPIYFSPEQADRKPYDWAVHVWCLGCLIYELAAGRAPFSRCDTFGQLLMEIRARDVDFDAVHDQQTRNLLKAMLQKEPECRPSIDELLNHDTVQLWITAFVDKINGKVPKQMNQLPPKSDTFSLLTTIQQQQTIPREDSTSHEAYKKQVALAEELPTISDPSVLAQIRKSVHERLAAILILPSRINSTIEGAADFSKLQKDLKTEEMEKILAAGLIADILYIQRVQNNKLKH